MNLQLRRLLHSDSKSRKPYWIVFALTSVQVLCSCGPIKTSSQANTSSNVSSWTEIDGNSSQGINRATSTTATAVALASLNSKLYAAWSEPGSSSGVAQIRVAVFGGDFNVPRWSFVDGNLPDQGINRLPTHSAVETSLAVVGTKLYASWREQNANGIGQIRVSVYNGDDVHPVWTHVDGSGPDQGINFSVTQGAIRPRLATMGGILYAAWVESNASVISQFRVAKYNGDDTHPSWTFVDGNGSTGLNRTLTQSATSPELIASSDALYAAWSEPSNSSSISLIRVSAYSGGAWHSLDPTTSGGLNFSSTMNAVTPRLTVANGKIYAAWIESNNVSLAQARISRFNGNITAPVWTLIDGGGNSGLNFNNQKSASFAVPASFASRLFTGWIESNRSNYAAVRVAASNGTENTSTTWTFVDGNGESGLNRSTTASASELAFLEFSAKLIAIWPENGKIRLAAGQ